MSRVNGIAGAAVVAVLMLAGAAPVSVRAQGVERPRRTTTSYNQAYQIAYDRGYRGGYDRGTEARLKTGSNNPNDYAEYRSADDGYNKDVGSRDDYTLGYRSGFEQGFDDGFNGNQYGAQPGVARATVQPHGGGNGGPVLRRSPDAGPDPTTDPDAGGDPNDPNSARGGVDPNDPNVSGDPNDPNPAGVPAAQGPARVGQDATLVIELTTPITTEYSQQGDRFSARVVEPAPYAGSIVDGYIGKITRPGKVSGKGEIARLRADHVPGRRLRAARGTGRRDHRIPTWDAGGRQQRSARSRAVGARKEARPQRRHRRRSR